MNLIIQTLILLYGIYICNAGYGIPGGNSNSGHYEQSDVQAPAYLPSNLANRQYTKTSYRGYSGTKTGYSGTKTGYSGTKTGYSGTKTGYSGTKTGYSGTKNGGSHSPYTIVKTWNTNYGGRPNYNDFQNNANQPFTPKCDTQCKNNGICIDTNTCQCPEDYYGNYCEFKKKPCLTYPPLPINSMRKCSSDYCTITCMEGHKMIDGTTVASMRCMDGQWQPTRADFTTIPDCTPECDPPCLNGGLCLNINTCQCPADYRGPQCQYLANVCDVRKLAFNGGYNCFGNSDSFSCKLSCPSGARFNPPPALLYVCQYSTGVFLPQPIPHCEFSDFVVITPNNGHDHHPHHYHHNHTHTETPIDGKSHTKYIGHQHTHTGGHGETDRPITIVVQDLTPKGGSCMTWAGAHYKTFDGRVFSFQSPCQHILVRDAVDHKYTVAIKHGNCTTQSYCPSELTIYLEDKPYVLAVAEDSSVIFRSTKRLIPIPASLPGIRVAMPRDYVVVNLDNVGVTIKWDINNFVVVEGTVLLWNNTEGLCGRLDGNVTDDFTTKEGNIATTKSVMASSWQINKIGDICDSSPSVSSECVTGSEEVAKKATQFCNTIFSKDKFRKCSKVMDVSLLLEACQWDYCTCSSNQITSSEECACSTVSVYAKECLRHGVEDMKNWRDAQTCPMKCPDGKLYRSCGPDAQPSCAFPLIPTKTDNSTCVEGCFCPEGLLLEGGRCVPKTECPCRLRNKSFPPGAVMNKDCNTCTCQSGEWSCTQVPCGARCGAVGDPHYTTFDGLRYDFMGHCTYTMLQTDNFTIEVENVACSGSVTEAMNLSPYKGEGKPSCTKAVKLIYGGANIHMKQGGFILVNGKEVTSLPVIIGDVRIRAASSLFVIVQMPNKVDLWWDGNTRVFVDVPAEFHDKTKGLCGTFNLNQKDDFLTPENDVEQSALAFANKWKTREFCSDVVLKEPEHPCKANVENKEAATNYCNKLKSKVFEECHWYVDVEPYFEWCMYDMCACAASGADVARCLCPVLGDYAAACARAGPRLQWRYYVKECELSCTGGQEYTVCADSCLRKCTDMALGSDTCKPCCVEGCACPVGQLLDDNNVCVPVGLCPCYHKGMQFNAGYKEVRPGKRERELCTCVGARWECIPATPDQILEYPPAEDLRSNCSAANNMEFTTCEISEPLTCKNMHLPQTSTTTECRPGCQCKKDYVLDTASKKCVHASECPCHHGGRSYPDGHVMQEECNKCECKSGNWSCSARKCAGVCSVWGDSHVTTFDGTDYDFEGVCTYLLAKGAMDSKDGFDVQIQNVPCGTTGATCSKSITLKVGGGDNEESVSLTQDAPLPDISSLKRIKLRIAGAYVFLDVPSLGMSLQWDHSLRVYVRVNSMWRGRVKGLCGNYNSDMRDDFQTPSGGGMAESSALLFADSWKMKPSCPKPHTITDHCSQRPERKEWALSTCGAMKRYPFSLCASEVEAVRFVERCARDACACDAGGDCACACAALAAYAHACAERGVLFHWRSQELCPMQCDEECSNYKSCVSPCPLETCDNTLYYSEMTTSCEDTTCVEGCKPKKACPEGQVYSNSTFKECVPRAKCKPVCMTLADGTEVLEGEVIEEDACHTCRCSKKEKVCKGQPCSTEAPVIGSSEPSTVKPHDEPLKCKTGWTKWISRGPPEIGPFGESIDNEPLPKSNELQIGEPMCKQEMMKKIECRTVTNHLTPKDTGLNVECSLERGLVCREIGNVCPDFEIRVYCECEEDAPCVKSQRPYEHPTDCTKFYECSPSGPVLKDCGPGTMYNPGSMICDWPAAVVAVKPECGTTTLPTTQSSTPTTPSTTTEEPTTLTTASPCPPGQVFKQCAYPCNKLCDYFSRSLLAEGKCNAGQKCVEGCVDESVANINCDYGSYWRDNKTCVPLKDCTCYSNGNVVKPGGVVVDGCIKCQCLDNAFHCDATDCVSINVPPEGSTHLSYIMSVPTTPTTHTTPPVPSSTASPTTSIGTTVVPPAECEPSRYIDLLGDQPLPESSFTASSFAGDHFAPHDVVLQVHNVTQLGKADSWIPENLDTNQYVQIELPRREPIYGVKMAGSQISDQFVTSYELMYGDDGTVFNPVTELDGQTKVFSGPNNRLEIKKQMIEPPIEAKFIRVRPLTWHQNIAVRLELIGCQVPVNTSSTTEMPTTSTPRPVIIVSTATPPPECSPTSYKNLLWEEERLPASSFTASSAYNAMFAPQYAIFNGKPESNTAGSWSPEHMDLNQYIQVELPRKEPIYGIIMQGNPLFNQYVTSYEVMYGDDAFTFSTVNGPDGNPKVFRGPVNSNTPLKQMIEPPIDAKVVRVRPLTWHDAIAVRFELIGCQEPSTTTLTTVSQLEEQCKEPLGLAAELPINDIEVSSNSEDRKYFKLDGERGWRPLYSTPGEWIMFNFTSPRNITGIKTKGGLKGWVTTYNIMYTSDLTAFNPIVDEQKNVKVFAANFDKESEVMHSFRPPIHAQYLKVLPKTWKDNIEMRIEPIGCFKPYPATEATPQTTTERTERAQCSVCPSVPEASPTCACAPPLYYDGEDCVPRDQCPCFQSYMSYPVGSTFRGSNCDECVCKLGGVTDCEPAKECKCAANQVPKLTTDTCTCNCEPCPSGTKICPTSKVCLPEEKWCDGLQDCPDDEVGCSTSPTPITEPIIVTTVAPTVGAIVTTPKPVVCPVVECPPGYIISYTSASPSRYSHSSTSDLPPPRARYSYMRYHGSGGGYGGGSFTKTKYGYSKGGYSKGGYSKGGRVPPPAPTSNQAFTLNKPSVGNNPVKKEECQQFRCIPPLPRPPSQDGRTPPPVDCPVITCPQGYKLTLEKVPAGVNQCPQYECVPPPERPAFCNMTGRTFNTFDGVEYKYDICFHVLARENRFNSWTVIVRKKCNADSCRNELIIVQDDQLIIVKPTMMIEYNDYEYTVEQTNKICFQKNSFDVARLGNGIAIKSRKYNFAVMFNSNGDIKTAVSKEYRGSVDGLCGAFDGHPQNDRRLPDGRLARNIEEFGRSWAKPGMSPDSCRLRVQCSGKQEKIWSMCDVITHEPLSKCDEVLKLDKWRSICLEKICECTDQVVNGTKRTAEECRCELVEQLVAECLAGNKNLDVSSWRMSLNCPAECPAPLVHYDCFRKRCEPMCTSPGVAQVPCPVEDGQCVPGCYCPEGTLRKGDTCISPMDCLDCSCTGVGAPAKYKTFEGDDLPFLGNCTYLASRFRNESEPQKYQVYATNGPCEENSAIVCTKSVHIVSGNQVVHISRDPDSEKLLTTITETNTDKRPGVVFQYPLKNDWFTISLLNGQDVVVFLPNAHVQVTVLQVKLEFTVQVPSYLYSNRTEGVCGVCAGYQEKLVTSKGLPTDDFDEYASSWQASPPTVAILQLSQETCELPPPEPECVPLPPETNPCYNLYNAAKFGACHALVEPESYVESCATDLCTNASDLCAALQAYVSVCRAHGVCLPDWREGLCPYPCAKPLVYHACVGCERTCENNEDLTSNPEKCTSAPVEGCFCPEGKVRVNNTCIEPSKCFPCDAEKKHYAGDEWQESECITCKCSKLTSENEAHLSCTTQSCTTPVCSDTEDLVTRPAAPGHCCPDYVCVNKPLVEHCEEPKKLSCGFGQVLKQKTLPNGCTEFACECKPESECEVIPDDSDVEIMVPGMQRVIDKSGCCPQVQMLCRPNTCPEKPQCEQFHELKTENTGKCCPQYSCELPKDKCVVTLEWEASPKGGEVPRTSPQIVLKDVDTAWQDGPCRTCRCEVSPGAAGAAGAAAQCSVTRCEPIASTERLLVQPRSVPFACCAVPDQRACRDGDNVYQPGEKWTSPTDVCEERQCVQESGKLERVTTLRHCDIDCQPGWKYFPSDNSSICCGKCKPVACVVDGEEKPIGAEWSSPDFCTNYTCVAVDGTMQVQKSEEVCPTVSDAIKKQFVLDEKKIPGKCCSEQEPLACRVGNKIYQEGQTWPTSDPCKNVTCARDVTGRLTHVESKETCVRECQLGWKYQQPAGGVCCGHCVQDKCVVDGVEVEPGTEWQSPDNCTKYSCEKLDAEVSVITSRQACLDVSTCNPENIVNETCCQVCREKPLDLSKCTPVSIALPETVGLVHAQMGPHGLCINTQPIQGFTECKGSCESGTLYSNMSGSHENRCECCQAVQQATLSVELSCADGSVQPRRVRVPRQCACARCGASPPASYGVKNPAHHQKGYEVSQLYKLFGEASEKPRPTEEDFEIPNVYRLLGQVSEKPGPR